LSRVLIFQKWFLYAYSKKGIYKTKYL